VNPSANIAAQLKKHHLRHTKSRVKILEVFSTTNKALSQQDIENKIGSYCDRATIYRTINSFVEKGVLHKIIDEGMLTKYALCEEACSHNEHNHNHAHFKCGVCNETSCLHEIKIQFSELPKGYSYEESNLLIKGLCPNCR
jgi:Fur family transcriptional regulator, ferric uptake regulator